MHLLFFFIALFGTVQTVNGVENILTLWNQFKSTHGKQYADFREERYRMRVFQKNVAFIDKHNSETNQGLHSYTLKVNQFADMTNEEFVKTMASGFKSSAKKESSGIYNPPSNVELPAAVDWRKKGAVTNVIENQGQCGSCWAFTATGALEGQHAIKTGNLVRLSAQNLMDCSTSFGNEGCNGGMMDYAFDYIKSNDGVDTEASYPYEARDGTCRFKRENVGATDTGFVDLPVGNETALTIAIALVGPISTAIDAQSAGESFQFYSSGVYDQPNCGKSLCHSFVLVGYDTFNNGTVSKDYYIAKNSWGDKWGMNGYVWMSRNKNNQCGIANIGSYPTV